MQDLIRFVWRGALGGAIVPLMWYVYFLIIAWPLPFFRYLLVLSFWITAIPGAIVGTILWLLCVRFVDRLGTLSRIIIGVEITIAMITLWVIFTTPSLVDELFESPLSFFWILLYALSMGGLAGWLCPAALMFRKEPELPYWERVREYEAAQAEHDYWKAQISSSKSPEEKHSA